MEKLQSKKKISFLSLLLCLTYMVSYITRINYGAIISEMENATSFSRSLLSMAVTGSFVTYGAGQIVTGILGDKFPPKKLVALGFMITILMNLLIPICTSPYQMTALWCINGFAQAFMWPPMVRMMTALLSTSDYKKVTSKVSFGASFGTIVVYLISPLLISFAGWKSVFIFSAICGIIMLIVWQKCAYNVDGRISSVPAEKSAGTGSFLSPVIFAIMLTIVLQGMLRDSVSTWTPSYISEMYNLGSTISILTGVVLPLFSIACLQASAYIYRKKFKNPMACTALFFGIGIFPLLLLILTSGKNPAVSVLALALHSGAMHGVNLMLTAMIPPFFKKYGNVSTVSGLLNSCTYIGSAISTYGIAVISESYGWGITLYVWAAIAVLGTAIALLCIKPWSKKFN